jgi:hypothetical protein
VQKLLSSPLEEADQPRDAIPIKTRQSIERVSPRGAEELGIVAPAGAQ